MRAEMKIPGGKLLQVDVTVKDGIIEDIHFYGDFFLHPEEKIEELENALTGRNLSEIDNIITSVLAEAEMAGISPDDFSGIIKLALGERNA